MLVDEINSDLKKTYLKSWYQLQMTTMGKIQDSDRQRQSLGRNYIQNSVLKFENVKKKICERK